MRNFCACTVVSRSSHVLIGTVTALLATEPEQSARAEAATCAETAFVRVLHAALGAFTEFLARKDAMAALAFVVLFKFTDAFSGTMTAPFVIDLGFSRNDYAAIVKGVGLAATLIGGFAGGFVALIGRRATVAAVAAALGVAALVGAVVLSSRAVRTTRYRPRRFTLLDLGIGAVSIAVPFLLALLSTLGDQQLWWSAPPVTFPTFSLWPALCLGLLAAPVLVRPVPVAASDVSAPVPATAGDDALAVPA